MSAGNMQLDLSARSTNDQAAILAKARALKFPSLVRGLSWEEYRAIEADNFSTVKHIDVSGKHYRHNLAHPTESDPLRLGQAAHCMVLEPKLFESRFAVWRERKSNGDMAARYGAKYDSWEIAQGGRTILTEDQETEALRIQHAIMTSPDAMPYLAHGDPEVTLLWQIGNRRCKGRIDWLQITDAGPVIVGIKTAVDIRPDHFGRAATRLLYGLQWPFYFDGYQSATGVRPFEIVEIVVEKKEPYDVMVYGIEDEELEIGRAEYMALLERLEECRSANSWPGVANGAKKTPFKFPAYKYQSDDDLADTGIQW